MTKDKLMKKDKKINPKVDKRIKNTVYTKSTLSKH